MPNYRTRSAQTRKEVRRGAGCGPRLLLLVLLVGGVMFAYYASTTVEYNEITGEEQRIGLSVDEELELGEQAAPLMIEQHGGLHPNQQAQAMIDRVGARLVSASAARSTPYRFDFHLLADEELENAFALPGGHIFITAGLMRHFKTEDELAGVLGHEMGHVVGRHSAELISKSRAISGIAALVGTAVVGGEGLDGGAQLSNFTDTVLSIKYGPTAEYQSDKLGLRFMFRAGYDIHAMVRVMQVLKEEGEAGPPAFLSTHPDPGDRIEKIKEEIKAIQKGTASWQSSQL